VNLKTSIQKRLRESIYNNFPFDGLVKDEKYISAFTSKTVLPNGKVFEFNHHESSKHRILPDSTSKILGLVNEFKTLFKHAAEIENSKLANFHQALKTLQELHKTGLLMSQSDFLNLIANGGTANISTKIDTLCWITRDRTASVKKSVESFIKNIIETDKEYDLFVFDDSSLKNYKKNKQNFKQLDEKYGTRIRLIGRTERELFINKICQKLENKVPKHVVKYGLKGLEGIEHRTGANRNTFQLFTTRKYALLTDDDIFCQISKNGDDEKLTITSDASFADVSSEFFTGPDELNSKILFDHHNPIRIHQKLLGHTMGSLVNEYRNKTDLIRFTPKFATDNLNTERKVRITMIGAAGDSGAGSPISKVFTSGNNLIKLISDTKNFKAKMYSRTVLQSHESLTIGPPNFLLGMNLGIDNTELLPPFHPNFRNSDGIFASVLRKCFSNAYMGYLPYAISHIPPDERPVDDSDLTSTSVRIPDILRFSIDEFNNKVVSAVEGLKSLGAYLIDISKRQDFSLSEYLKLISVSLITGKIYNTEQLYKKHYHINKQWAEIMEQRMEILYNYIQDDTSKVLYKEVADLTYENQLQVIRKVYRNFGELLFYWPEIYNCVQSYKKQLIN
jgi:hypothetical protein